MKRVLAAPLILGLGILILGLAGCSTGSGRFVDQPGPVVGTPSINQEPTDAGPTSQEPPRNLTPAARSAAKGASERNTGVLMECVTESCRINCSPRLEKRVRPKWCANFEVPN